MPDFNKGDFTQQGVNGHVNAIVRLNEKRLVYIDLTSNEEAEGCTITGAVADPLNNKVYNIGSGGGGGSEVKTFALSVYNNGTGTASVGSLYLDDDGILNEGFEINTVTTVTKNVLIRYDTDVTEYFVAPETGFGTDYVSYSNAVNCTVFDEDGIYIVITDINEPASVTIEVHKDIV